MGCECCFVDLFGFFEVFGDVVFGEFDVDIVWECFDGVVCFEEVVYFVDYVVEVMGFVVGWCGDFVVVYWVGDL